MPSEGVCIQMMVGRWQSVGLCWQLTPVAVVLFVLVMGDAPLVVGGYKFAWVV